VEGRNRGNSLAWVAIPLTPTGVSSIISMMLTRSAAKALPPNRYDLSPLCAPPRSAVVSMTLG
jgi:hypothetical protein